MHDFLPPQPQPPHTAAARPGPVRLAPLRGETNLSYLDRLADRYRLGVRDLIPALLQVGGGLFKGYRTDGEVYLNAEARARVCAFSRVPEEILQRALPAWNAQEPLSPDGAGTAGRFRFGSVVPAAGEGCRLCTAARTGRAQPARLYLQPHTRICPRHQRWMLGTHWIDGAPAGTEQVDLTGLPEMIAGHRRHLNLLCHRPDASKAFEVAHAVAVSWWAQQWPEEEQWPRRALQLAPPGTDPGWWRLLARDAVIYPETVALASVLVDERFRRRLLAESGGHLPHTLADTPALVSELAQITNRGWLPEKIASTSAGPLLVWVHHCVRSPAGANAADRLWTLHMAHRPRAIARELQAYRDAGRKPEAVGGSPSRGRGLRLTPERAFHTGLAHARAYAALHGHLAAPIGERFNGFALGRWLSNHRKSPAVPPEHVAELEALDPWWRPPWTVMWQRTYYEARDHARAQGGLRLERGFPATSFGLGEWLYNQCTGYDDLHPAQQRLLSGIGLTSEAVRAARPRRKHMATHFERTLGGASAYARAHGTLVTATADTVQDGFKLGQWLANQRSKDRAYQLRHGAPSPRALALLAIDPWWNPPWALEWQRSWHQAHTHIGDGHVLDAAAGFPGTSSALGTWLTNQCAQYDTLQPDQQDLLTRIGLAADRARGAAARPAEREADFAVGLGYARSYHSTHGTLAAPINTVHDGFELGRWLGRQRQHARTDADRGAPQCTAAKALTAVDPWWCPHLSLAWQRAWQHIHHQVRAGHQPDAMHEFRNLAPAERAWLRQQISRYDDLHPGQQHLLADIGLSEESIRTRPVTPYAETALKHARGYTAAHGSLATPYCAVHDGFPLGSWLARQRLLAHNANTPYAIHRALTMLDPWWNPPWPMRWQRAYHHARTTPINAGTSSWAAAQRAAWRRLHPQQRALLTDIGITPENRTTTQRREATRTYPPSPGLAHARAWAKETGNLYVPKNAHHEGFPLGTWLIQQRRKAGQRRLSPATLHTLNTIDPWWNPPWPYHWHRTYHQAQTCHRTGQPYPPRITSWIQTQHRDWPRLHPQQQHLLTTIDIHPG
ncbi:Helicase associated domain protein [Streptomyces sp. NPDC058728]|uniref:Helicase associated domain protein n=2 Tax=Streptomyces TaxID=1883 RepID=UPI003650D5CE